MAQLNPSETIPVPFLVTDLPAQPTTEADAARGTTLQDLEAIIARGLPSHLEVGRALYEIREGRLYRQWGSGATFESYCAERWGFARQTAYDYISAAVVTENVRTSVHFQPSLSQGVALASLELTHQREVAEAIEAEGRTFDDIPVRDVREIVRKVRSGVSPSLAVHYSTYTKVEVLEREDTIPDPPEDPITQTGGLWILGDHRLLVGDAVALADVERLMAGDAADLIFTDPPYNVAYEGYTVDRLKIKGDRLSFAAYKQLLEAAFRSCRSVTKPTASLYVCHPSSWQREFQGALEAAGFEIRSQIIWAKNTFGWGFGRYKFQHEPIFYCHVAGQTDAWYGDKTQSTLWQENKPLANRLHPTMKPVELIERALTNSSKVGDFVLDLFGGSGSTLIACERTRRKARLMEIDPRYADVIVRRWQDHTGKGAILENDGRTFDEIVQERLTKAA
jgi:DNA modification methylase